MGERPNPDVLLERVLEDEKRAKRGRLTVFFGAAPGVGKTYAMLEAARFEREDGRDAIVGIVETHGRYDTAALLLGLEIVPRKKLEHRGVVLEELDIEACLKRRPGLLLVDELAHTNAPGSRHAKRWQDVEELLEAGLDVYSTLNVQHLESLNDVVAQITHVVVTETVPDSVLEGAEEIRLIDLPIEELLERLKDGKVYLAEQAERAGKHFFRPGNLIALRELALRTTAQSVDAQMRRYRAEHGIDKTWAATERLLVCVSPSPSSPLVIRGARRLARSLHADWIAAFVETSASLRLTSGDRARVAENLHHARTLGAETVTLAGEDGAEEVVRFARERNVTRIIVGKPTHSTLRDRIQGSFLESLVRLSGNIDVHAISGDVEKSEDAPAVREPARARPRQNATGFLAGLVAVGLATVIGKTIFPEQLADVVMVYLFGIVLVSLRWGLAPSLFAAVVAVVAFDYFCIPPFYTLAVTDLRHIVTFAVMFLVAVVISGLTKRVRDQAESAREREVRTASLYALSRALASAKSRQEILLAGTKHIQELLGGRVSALVPSPGGALVSNVEGAWTYEPDDNERRVAELVWQQGTPAGAGTDTLPASGGTYFPIDGSEGRLGVIGIVTAHGARTADHQERHHLDAFLAQIGSALDRVRLARQAQAAQLRVEAEQLRNSLLSSVSHDLRTPLAVITGTATTLTHDKLDAAARRDLAETIVQEAERLNRLVRNLLDMTRVEAGALTVHKEWQPVEEVFGSALGAVESILGARPVKTDLSSDLVAPFDAVLIQQVLVNLLENAVKYAGPDTPLTVSARGRKHEVEIVVADRGPGLPAGDETRIFEKFYRAEKGKGGGVGLGLTICRGIVTAHGGRIWASSREGGGAAFHFTLPIEGEPPSLDMLEPQRRAEEMGAP